MLERQSRFTPSEAREHREVVQPGVSQDEHPPGRRRDRQLWEDRPSSPPNAHACSAARSAALQGLAPAPLRVNSFFGVRHITAQAPSEKWRGDHRQQVPQLWKETFVGCELL